MLIIYSENASIFNISAFSSPSISLWFSIYTLKFTFRYLSNFKNGVFKPIALSINIYK